MDISTAERIIKEKLIQEFGGGVECSWSRSFKRHYTQDMEHRDQIPFYLSTPKPETSKHLIWAKGKGLDCCSVFLRQV